MHKTTRRTSCKGTSGMRAYCCYTALAVAIATCLPVYTASAQAAVTETTIRFDIPAGDLAGALERFSTQSGIQLLYRNDLVAGKRARAVAGAYTPDAALRRLLEGASVETERLNEGTIVLKRASVIPQTPPSTPRNPESTSEPGAKAAGTDEATTLADIVVTGTRIHGMAEVALPTRVITREEMELSGATTLEAYFQTLPENFSGAIPQMGAAATNQSAYGASAANTRATGIDLRGLGPDSTLVLVNGRRRATGDADGRFTDISTIPLSAVDRIEILHGGGSSLYGSDAVAGIVNIILRKEFRGSQTTVGYGTPTNYSGGEQLTLGQHFAYGGDRTSLFVNFDFHRERASNFLDLGLFPPEDQNRIYTYQPFQHDLIRRSVSAVATAALTDRLEFYSDITYTSRDSSGDTRYAYFEAQEDSRTYQDVSTRDYSLSSGLKWQATDSWWIDLSGTKGRSSTPYVFHLEEDQGPLQIDQVVERKSTSTVRAVEAVADGDLFTAFGRTASAAFGVEWRHERLERETQSNTTYTGAFEGSDSNYNEDERTRLVRSAFAEVRYPILPGNESGVGRLESVFGGRADNYADLGNARTWNVGLIWQISPAWSWRSSYTTAFRAPAFVDTATTGFATVNVLQDPTVGGVSRVLSLGGLAPADPETAKNWSFGLNFRPANMRWADFSLSYISIEYDNRIANPMTFQEFQAVLSLEERYASLINRTPSLADIEAFFAADSDGVIGNAFLAPGWDPVSGAAGMLEAVPGLILVDRRTQNIAIDRFRGVDLSMNTRFDTSIGQLVAKLNVSRMIERGNQVTRQSEFFSTKDVVGRPVGMNMRTTLGWIRGPWSVFGNVAYKPSYDNPFSVPESTVGSYTLVDLAVRFDAALARTNHWLGKSKVTLSVNNLFEERPPAVSTAPFTRYSYDPANAAPSGRYVNLSISRQW